MQLAVDELSAPFPMQTRTSHRVKIQETRLRQFFTNHVDFLDQFDFRSSMFLLCLPAGVSRYTAQAHRPLHYLFRLHIEFHQVRFQWMFKVTDFFFQLTDDQSTLFIQSHGIIAFLFQQFQLFLLYADDRIIVQTGQISWL